MTVDRRGRDAARALRGDLDPSEVERRLDALRRKHERRSSRRSAVGASLVVAAVAVTLALVRAPEERDAQRTGPTFPALGSTYEVIATDVSPSGRLEAVATLRDNQSSVVLVRRSDGAGQRVVWSAETPQELVRRNASRPVAVAWAPGDSSLAFLLARRPFGAPTSADDVLTLVVVDPDGSGRRHVPARLGRCSCTRDLPTLTWSASGAAISVAVPRGAAVTHHEIPIP